MSASKATPFLMLKAGNKTIAIVFSHSHSRSVCFRLVSSILSANSRAENCEVLTRVSRCYGKEREVSRAEYEVHHRSLRSVCERIRCETYVWYAKALQ